MKWIDITKEKPEIKDVGYYCHMSDELIVSNGKDVASGVYLFSDGVFAGLDDTGEKCNRIENVTHWMYLPKPPIK